MGTATPSDYEWIALDQIHQWKNPELGWFGHTMRVINWPLDKAGDTVMATPGVGVGHPKSGGRGRLDCE